MTEQIRAAVYGHLVGDAIGVPYEFGHHIETVELRGHGTHNQPPGTWSDDGALMLALLDSLLAAGFDPEDQGRRALAWADAGAYTPDGDGMLDSGHRRRSGRPALGPRRAGWRDPPSMAQRSPRQGHRRRCAHAGFRELTVFERFVSGRPAPFATAGERPWKDALATQLLSVPGDPTAGFIELDFVIAPAVGYARGADLDNFCEPVFSVIANRIGWFGGSRPNIRAFRARKTLAEPTGCRILITADRWDGTWVDGV
jgi:hypothetical protein